MPMIAPMPSTTNRIQIFDFFGFGTSGVATPLTTAEPSIGEPQFVQFLPAAPCGLLHAGQ
jgi:hypothetical protein